LYKPNLEYLDCLFFSPENNKEIQTSGEGKRERNHPKSKGESEGQHVYLVLMMSYPEYQILHLTTQMAETAVGYSV
jgi:hypothetical protein